MRARDTGKRTRACTLPPPPRRRHQSCTRENSGHARPAICEPDLADPLSVTKHAALSPRTAILRPGATRTRRNRRGEKTTTSREGDEEGGDRSSVTDRLPDALGIASARRRGRTAADRLRSHRPRSSGFSRAVASQSNPISARSMARSTDNCH